MPRKKKQTREHRTLGGSIVRVRDRHGDWRPGIYGQVRTAEGRRLQRLLVTPEEVPTLENPRKVAEDRLAAWALEVRSAEPAEDGTRQATLAKFLETYYEAMEARLSERTFEEVRNRLDRAARYFGTLNMAQIDRAAAEDYIVKLGREAGRLETVPVLDDAGKPEFNADGTRKTRTIAHPMTPGTLRAHRTALSACWTMAADRGYASGNPWRQVKVARGQQYAARFVTFDEVRRILDHVRADVRPILAFMAETGLRLGEARDLTWVNVEKGFGQFIVARSKSGRTRTVPCTVAARAILEAAWDTRVTKLKGPDYVFPRMDRHTVWEHFHNACAAAGIAGRVRVHDLRHHVGASLAQAGVAIPTIMGILGHSQIQTTQRYAAHVPMNATAQAFAALDASRGVVPAAVSVGA